MAISLRAPHGRPDLSTFVSSWCGGEVFPFVFRVALRAATKNQDVHEKDVLPRELAQICSRFGKHMAGGVFRTRVSRRIDAWYARQPTHGRENRDAQALRNHEKRHANIFLNERLESLLEITRAVSAVLGADARGLDSAYVNLIETWQTVSRCHDTYTEEGS